MSSQEVPAEVLRVAARFVSNARTPFSRRPAAAVVVLSDGTMVPGVRVESASFPLTIPAALNAITTAFASGRDDLVALHHTGPIPASTSVLASGFGLTHRPSDSLWTSGRGLPPPTSVLEPFAAPPEAGVRNAILRAHDIASRAHIPESSFPVGAILRTRSGRWLAGVNVEHPDWACILCAERNALGTAVTFGEQSESTLALSCPKAPGASPCGGCRQLLAELAPNITVWMDQGEADPVGMTPSELLPLAFSGDSLDT